MGASPPTFSDRFAVGGGRLDPPASTISGPESQPKVYPGPGMHGTWINRIPGIPGSRPTREPGVADKHDGPSASLEDFGVDRTSVDVDLHPETPISKAPQKVWVFRRFGLGPGGSGGPGDPPEPSMGLPGFFRGLPQASGT